MSLLPTQQLRLYRNFKAIEETDYFETIRFYHRHESELNQLDFEAFFDCTYRYAEALFQTEDWAQHAKICDVILMSSIENNIDNYQGQDVFISTLVRKGMSQFFLQNYREAQHTLKQAIRIAPWYKPAAQYYQRTLLHVLPSWLTQLRTFAVGGILMAVIVRCVTFLLIQPLFPELSHFADTFLAAILLLGPGLWLIGESVHFLVCAIKAHRFVQKSLSEKNKQN